ncbi:MAG: tripartite tricarboxylate transporter substrate binding protein [Herminiimonas sp.]|nr:tripartite tricarboxylate transporter substrate binding protein [Herminiimonas sp.]
MHRRFILKLAVVLLPALSFCTAANAQEYPTRPITLVAPFSPGGALDLIARSVAQKLNEAWGQAVIVDNKAGAAGIIGSQYVAKAAPDGYTLLLGATTTHGINPSLYKKLSYDAVKDFAPVSLVATIPHILVVNPNLPVNNLAEFIKYGKSKPLTFGSAGIGSPHHLAGEMLKSQTNLDLQHVPYKGSAPAMLAVMSGEIDFMSVEVTAATPYIIAGRLKPIAAASAQRIPTLPNLATFEEQGIHNFEVTAWYAVFAPKETPKDIVAKLSGAIAKAVAMDDVKKKFATLGAVPVGSSPEQLRVYVNSEITRWAGAVKASGAKVE